MPDRNKIALRCLFFAVVALPALTVPAQAQRLPLPPEEQDAVNQAIDRAVEVLKRAQLPNGTWALPEGDHQVGYAVLPALTLLECGVSPKDPLIQRTARFLREKGQELDGTYELALSILFMDRLNDPKNKRYIQWFTMRLIAGQTMTGGWGYKCPKLDANTYLALMATLRHLEAKDNEERVLGTVGESPGSGSSRSKETPAKADDKSKDAKPIDKPVKDAKPLDKPDKKTTTRPFVIPPLLRDLPVVVDPKKHVLQEVEGATTDNSNTQFALLALWTAQRHDVPLRRTLNLVIRRFETSQNDDGTWGYKYRQGGGEGGSPAMTNVGLIGLALGYGLEGQPVKDKRLVNGLAALSKSIGQPVENSDKKPAMQNLYFLWSLERVAVLYNLAKIGDKDWYRWGAQILVANQQANGGWTKGEYPGSAPVLDTCLALLFLQRANLAKDLSSRLAFKEADLNKEVMDKLTPTPPPETPKPTPPPPEQTKPKEPVITKPEVKEKPIDKPSTPITNPTAMTPTEPVTAGTATESSSSTAKVWIAVGLILVAALAGGGSILLLVVLKLAGGKKKEEEETADEKPKKKRKPSADAGKSKKAASKKT